MPVLEHIGRIGAKYKLTKKMPSSIAKQFYRAVFGGNEPGFSCFRGQEIMIDSQTAVISLQS